MVQNGRASQPDFVDSGLLIDMQRKADRLINRWFALTWGASFLFCVCLVVVTVLLIFSYRDVVLVGWGQVFVVLAFLVLAILFLVWLQLKVFGFVVARWLIKSTRTDLEVLLKTADGRNALSRLMMTSPGLRLELEMILGSRFLEKYPRDFL